MKSFLVIGAGRFGHYLCRSLEATDSQIMLVDRNEARIHDLLDHVTSARIGDCTHEEVLKSFGVEEFDACIVCVEESFQDSLEITYRLRMLGAKRILSLAGTEIQSDFLLRNGADEVIFPDRDMAERLGVRISDDSVFDYIGLTPDHSIFEITVPKAWVGKTIGALEVRSKYHVSLLATRDGDCLDMLISPDYCFTGREHLIVMGQNKDVQQILD